MKKLILVSAIAMSGLIYQNANAQIGVHFNINLGVRPVVVAPAPVYHDDYYYLPDVEAYYSVNEGCYYYQDGDRWVSAAYLPGAYRDYDWKHANHYAVNEPRPYLHNDVYRARYGGFDGRRDWNYRDDRSNNHVYADRDRFNHNDYNRIGDRNRDNQRSDSHNGYDNRPQQQQPQPQNNNRGNGGYNNQPSQPQNNNRGNGGGNNNQQGQTNDRSNDNNRGSHDNGGQGRMGRI